MPKVSTRTRGPILYIFKFTVHYSTSLSIIKKKKKIIYLVFISGNIITRQLRPINMKMYSINNYTSYIPFICVIIALIFIPTMLHIIFSFR